jgi:hypothetical protein
MLPDIQDLDMLIWQKLKSLKIYKSVFCFLEEVNMQIINRNLFIVRPKLPYVNWINAQPDQDPPVSLTYIQQDCHAYLMPEMINEDEALEYIQVLKREIFEIELNSWCRDTKVWPKRRTPAMFDEWFELEFHSMIFDLHRKKIRKE